MKNIYLIYTAFFALLILCASCFDEDEKFAKEITSKGSILVTVPTKALPPPPTGQPQLAEQNFDVTTARFGINDDVQMTIYLSEGLTNLKINHLVTSTGQREEKGSFTNVTESVNWVYPASTLGIGNTSPANKTGAAFPASVTLELVASNNDNSQKVVRIFTVNILEPFSLTNSFNYGKDAAGNDIIVTANPATANPDSVIVLGFTSATTSLANLEKVEIFVKRGVKSAETLFRTETYNIANIADTVRFRMPSGNTNPNTLDTLFFRYRASYATGKTISKTSSTRFVNVPLNTTVNVDSKQRTLALYNPAATGENGDRAAYDFSEMTHIAKASDEALKDIILQVSGLDIGFKAGSTNSTTFVKGVAADYTSASYQVAKWSHETKPVVTSVTNVFKGDVYIVRITDKTGYNEYVVLRVNDINLTPIGNETDNITLEYKYYKKP
ncbi:hypothetical protein [Chryseosolibacter indicus]|uniref:Uncharacterized protein n=1 Tax=Chryseosolibacter indicus TaxID=2782351 RepID=A0ABS5VS51_9BACT|nr:hypothetical protein [Chryseosolibacter indicus]MBT1704263.1 hypothetical protein [Chryseosolibacter indicus]